MSELAVEVAVLTDRKDASGPTKVQEEEVQVPGSIDPQNSLGKSMRKKIGSQGFDCKLLTVTPSAGNSQSQEKNALEWLMKRRTKTKVTQTPDKGHQ